MFTTSRIVVISTERMLWISFFVMGAAVVAFVALFVRSLIMFAAGLLIAVGIGLLFSLVNPFILRLSSRIKFKRLRADGKLGRGGENFDLPYSSIVRVERKQVKTRAPGGLICYIIPRPAQVHIQDVIVITTSPEKTYSFYLGHKELRRFMDSIHKIGTDHIHLLSP